MNRIAVLLVGICLAWADAARAADVPATFRLNGASLAEARLRLAAGDAALRPAFTNLLHQAEQAMVEGPFTVMDKSLVPPSGDKHDYLSFGRYWWPDPSQPDGLPYIQRDGETNPDSQGAGSDRPRSGAMCGAVETLALAYYFTGDERFADRATLLIRTWFLNPDTRMNPHLRYAQGIPGLEDGRSVGVLDGRLFGKVLDGVALLDGSSSWSDGDQQALHHWFQTYLDWLKTHPNARGESDAGNNHGTHFDAQIVHVALFVGEREFARSVVEAAIEKRILAQIKPDGSQPEELARTRTLHYCLFNLEGLFALARLGENVGVDLWHAENSRLRAALDFVAPYADPARLWPHPTINEADRIRLFPLLIQAAVTYRADTYRLLARQLLAQETRILRENLLLPPPR